MVAASPIASGSALAAPERILGAEDACAYRRYLEWSVGHGFKLAIIEVTMPRRRDELIAWTREAFPPVCVVDIDEAERLPLMAFLERSCPSPRDTSVLVLTRLDDAEDRVKLCARLNIQRDELAHAFPLPWVLIVHPATRLELEMHAPDFIDFAAVWLQEEKAEESGLVAFERFSMEPLPGGVISLGAQGDASGSDLLDQAFTAVALSRYDEAGDLLARYDLHHPEARATNAARMRLDGLLSLVRGRPVEALALFEEALRRCDLNADARLRVALLWDIANLRLESGALDTGLDLFQEAAKASKLLGDRSSHAAALRSIARLRAAKGDVEGALMLLQEAIEGVDEAGSRRERMLALLDIAQLHADRGEVTDALALNEEALRMFEELGDRRSRAMTLAAIARLRAVNGERSEALALLHEAAQVFEDLGDQRSRAIALADIAHLLADKGEMEKALELYLESLRVSEELGNLGGTANACWEIGKLEVERGHFREALKYQERAYALLAQTGRLDGVGAVGTTLGPLLLAMGKTAEAIAILERSQDSFERLGRHENARAVMQLLDKARQAQP